MTEGTPRILLVEDEEAIAQGLMVNFRCSLRANALFFSVAIGSIAGIFSSASFMGIAMESREGLSALTVEHICFM